MSTDPNVRDGIGLNNLTVIGNSAGLQFNAPLKKAYLANSIVLEPIQY